MDNILELVDVMNTDVVNMDSPYVIENRQVPRVTSILSYMLHDEYLLDWANRVGLYQRKNHTYYKDRAAYIGSITHDAIENYIINDVDLDISEVNAEIRSSVVNTYSAFKLWWEIIKGTNYEIMMHEQSLVCDYYGGTLDLLIRINGKIYLVDFKTSNHPSYKHFLQLSAYRYMLRVMYNIELDGCIVLMLGKKNKMFNEMILNFDNPEHLSYMNHCEQTFHSLVYGYYNRIANEVMYRKFFDTNQK